MCVLYGWIGSVDPVAMAEALAYGEQNSPHSAGITDGKTIFKKAVAPSKFIEDYWDEFSALAAKPVGIAHARFATVGTIVPENAHPFVHKDLIFAHNGTIENYRDFGNWSIDSKCLGPLIEENRLQEVKGTAGVLWIQKGKLYAYRHRKPLFAAFLPEGTVICTHSWILREVFGKKRRIEPIPEHTIVRVTARKLEVIEQLAVTAKPTISFRPRLLLPPSRYYSPNTGLDRG